MKAVVYDSQVRSVFEVDITEVDGYWVSEGGMQWPIGEGFKFWYGEIQCRLTLSTTEAGRWYLCVRSEEGASGAQEGRDGSGQGKGQGLTLDEAGAVGAPFLWGVCRYVDGVRNGVSMVEALLEYLQNEAKEECEPDAAYIYADAKEKAQSLLRMALSGGAE